MSLIFGSGGGKSGANGGGISEEPENLSSVTIARFIDLIGEGEIEGLVNADYSIYMDGVPMRDKSGTANFGSIGWKEAKGTQSQPVLEGFSGSLQEIAVGVQARYVDGKVIRTVTDSGADAARFTLSVPSLTETNGQGKISGSNVTFKLWKRRSVGSWVLAYEGKIEGKTSAKYQRSVEVPLSDLGAGPYEIAVERTKLDSASGLVQDLFYWDSYTIINYERLRYPNSAMIGVQIDARHFSSVPQRSYHVRGLKVLVPKNYDPVTRTYATTGPGTTSGAWDGTFKVAYTNNPAWCYYDLATSRRYGAGNYIIDKVYSGVGVYTEVPRIDKWALYEIGRYCDEPVPTNLPNSDTYGPKRMSGVSSQGKAVAPVTVYASGMEPRFTLNCVINTRDKAHKVLNQLASVFRGMSYWGTNNVTVVQDAPASTFKSYTNGNVKDGRFNYEGTGRDQRFSVCIVGWNDPADNFKQKFEYVEDREAISRYGLKTTEIVAFGCTSKSQARRYGLWLLYTQRLEQEAVSFRVGLDSAFVSPGKIIKILDNDKVGQRWGGRVTATTSTSVTLDAPVTLAAGSYTLTLISSTGAVVTRALTLGAGTYSDFTGLVTMSPSVPVAGSVWMIESATVKALLARVISVRRDGSEYEIYAVEHNPSKYNAVDTGTKIEEFNYTAISYDSVPAVSNLLAVENSYTAVAARDFISVLEVSWDVLALPTVRGYKVKLIGADKTVRELPESSKGQASIENLTPQQYTVVVRAVSVLGVESPEASVTINFTGTDQRTPPAASGLAVTPTFSSFELAWTAQSYNEGGGHERTEIYVNTVNNSSTATLIGSSLTNKFSYPALLNITRFFWIKSIAKNLKPQTGFTGPVSATTGLIGLGELPSGAINTNISISQDGTLNGAGGGQVIRQPVVDILGSSGFGARFRNDPPSEYPVGLSLQFKDMSTLGLPGGVGNGWCTLETNKGYGDSTGVTITQFAYASNGLTYKRYGVANDPSWSGPWVQDLDRNVYTGDLNATNDLNLVPSSEMRVSGNTISKVTGGFSWNAQVRSRESYVGGAYVQGTVIQTVDLMFGLNTDPDSSSSWETLDAAIFLRSDNAFDVRISGTQYGEFGSYAVGDVFAVLYNGTKFIFTKNGTQFFEYAAPDITAPHFFDSSFYSPGSILGNVRFGPMTANNWSSIGGANRPSDNATRDLVLVATGYVKVEGNRIVRFGGVDGWGQGQAKSRDGYTGAAYATATYPGPVGVSGNAMFGLNTDPDTNDDWSSIDYACYIRTDGLAEARMSGSAAIASTTLAEGDELTVLVDGSWARWLKNGVQWHFVAIATPLGTLYFDTSFYYYNGQSALNNVRFGPLSSNQWAVLGNRPTELTDGRVATAIGPTGVVISRVTPGVLASPSVTGLHLGSDYMGYWNSGAGWRTYMDNSGNFYLGGTTGALKWESGLSKLTVGNPTGARIEFSTTDGELLMFVKSSKITYLGINDQIADQAVNDFRDVSGGTATATSTLILTTDGRIQGQISSPTTPFLLANWYGPTTTNIGGTTTPAYYARATYTGTAPGGSNVNEWLGLNAQRSWSCSRTAGAGSVLATNETVLTIQISTSSTGNPVIATFQARLSSTTDGGG